ncbi:hypothetical protein V565_192060, partial [Rhizoctonia solani 123E]
MASPVNSNIMNAPTPTQNNLRRRSIRVASELIAKSAVNFVDIPGLKDSVQAARGIVEALKPNILQEPARNDVITQNLIDYLDEIFLRARAADANQANSEYLEDLRQIKAAVIELKDKTYGTKLVYRRDIGRDLEKRKEEVMERTLLFSVEGSVYGRRADTRSTELEARLEHISESFAMLQGELTSVKLQLAQLHRCAVFGNSFDLKFK